MFFGIFLRDAHALDHQEDTADFKIDEKKLYDMEKIAFFDVDGTLVKGHYIIDFPNYLQQKNIFDNYKICADFLLHYADILIPVEVGSGKKDKRQTTRTSSRIKKIKHKIIISNEENIKVDNNTIYIPLKTFLFS